MKTLKYSSLVVLVCALSVTRTFAQNVGINGTGAAPNASAMLDVAATNRGVLIPRVALTAANVAAPVAAPTTSLMVYNTATAGTFPNNVTPGHYYWDGARWVRYAADGESWKVLGNLGTTAPTSALGTAMNNNFLGTRDNISFVVGTNNRERMRILNTGQIGVNTQLPWTDSRLHAVAGAGYDGITSVAGTGSLDAFYGQHAGTGAAVTGVSSNTNGLAINGINSDATGIAIYGSSGGANPLLLNVGSGATFGSPVIGAISVGRNATGSTGLIGIGNNSGAIYTGQNGTGVAGTVSGGPGSYGVMGTYFNGTAGDIFGILGSSDNGGYFQFNDDIRASAASNNSGLYAQFNDDNITTIATATEGLFTQFNDDIYTVLSTPGYGLYTRISANSNVTLATPTRAAQFVLNPGILAIIGDDGDAVVGQSTVAGGTGVLGIATGAGSYGLYSMGNTGGTGTKAFHIDHPLDPANKFLNHYSVESNEVLNMYRGTVTLDSQGEANIEMPSYFNAININFSYQLTPVGAAMPNLFVLTELTADGKFKISGGAANKKVSWIVYGERNDEWVRQNPDAKAVEIVKPADQQGKYLQPELYGQPANSGIFHKEVITPSINVDRSIDVPQVKSIEVPTKTRPIITRGEANPQ